MKANEFYRQWITDYRKEKNDKSGEPIQDGDLLDWLAQKFERGELKQLPDDNETVEDGGGCYVAGARSNDPINGFVQYARKLRGENELLKEDLSGLREFKERMKKIVNEQAEDGGLWGFSETATEAYLQQALRRMHSEIETT